MSIGHTFQNGFKMMMNLHGTDVLIHKKFGAPNQTTSQVRGLKNSEKNKPEKVIFQFPQLEDIDVGDVVQLKAGRDQWRVIDTEDNIHGNVLVSFDVKVQKLNGAPEINPSSSPSRNSVVIHGPVYGAVQVGSHSSTQSVVVNFSEVESSLCALKKLIPKSEATELKKEEALFALERIAQLSKKEKNSEVIALAKDKLEIVKNTIQTAVELGKIAAPHIGLLAQFFS
jgi:hypothetical protein